jgi:hypothetical protein
MHTHTAASFVASRTYAIGTHYIPIHAMDDETTSISFKWTAGTTTTFKIQATNMPPRLYTDSDTSAAWQDLPLTLSNASGAGGQFVSFGNVGALRLRVVLVVTVALTGFEMYLNGVA